LTETQARAESFLQLPEDSQLLAVGPDKSRVEGDLLRRLRPEDQRITVMGQPVYGPSESQVKADFLRTMPEDDRRTATLGAQAWGPPMLETMVGGKPVYTPQTEAAGMGVPPKKPTVSITNDLRSEGEYSKTLGKERATSDSKFVDEIYGKRESAMAAQPWLDQMSAALASEKFKTGAFGTQRLLLSQVAEFVGADPEVLGFGLGDAVAGESVEAASRRLATTLTDRMSRTTNMSLKFIMDAVPNLSRSSEGNMVLVDLMQRINDRDRAVADLVDQYTADDMSPRKKGQKSLRETVAQYDIAHPIVDAELRKRITSGGSGGASSETLEIAPYDPSKRVKDKVYATPDGQGRVIWRGNGWERQ
jgi:hypothetical protein